MIMSSIGYNVTRVQFKGNDRLTLGIVLGVLTFWLFAQSMMNIVPAIQQDINIPSASLNLAISLTSLLSGCFIVVAGAAADKIGRVKMTYIGFVLSIVGCLLIIFASNTVIFAAGRVVQGLSGACIMPATLALMKTYYEGKARQRALSFWSIGSWGGSGICSLFGGAVATSMGWKWIFIFSIICALVGMLLIHGTPESKVVEKGRHRFDYLGLCAFVVMLISLNLIITKGSTLGWKSQPMLILFAVFVVSAIVFGKESYFKRQNGFIDLSLFKNKPYAAATFSNFMLNAAAGTLLVASLYVQQIRGFTAFQSGMLTIGYLIAVLAMIRVGERLLQKIGAKKPMLLGSFMTGIGIALMALTFLSNTAYVVAVLLGYILFGLGLGFYATPSTDTAISNAPADKVGIASGIYKMASSLGGAFGVAISASVYTALLSSGGATAATIGLLVNVLFCLLSFIAVLIMVPRNAGK
ncbi:MFS transporter [Lelliottia sp. V104_15]|nr:MFS transporter [Lelliottia sp. V104_15]MDK9606108.1 MFS transporter [Lelliottia sp. V104_15]